MRPFSDFTASLPPDEIDVAEASRLRSLATWGYLLLRPGMEFVRQRSNFILGWQAAAAAGAAMTGGVSAGAVGRADVPPLGSWMILPDLTSPATQTVLPSTDALYGAAHIELDRLGPVVLSVPANVDDRYFSVAVMDAHMNNVAHIGPRWTGHAESHHLLVPPGWEGEVPAGMSLIRSSTVSVCCYNRMLVRFEEGDLDRVRAWQAGLRITQLSSWGDENPVPDDVPVDDLLHPTLNTLTDPIEYLRIGLAHLARNPLVSEATWLASMVSDAGLTDVDPASDAGRAVSDGVDDGTRLLDARLTTWPHVNGWMRPDARLGLPNPDVLASAAFQQFQIGANDITESAYLFVDLDRNGSPIDCSGGKTYEVRFPEGQVPPVEESGYWSLTLYDEHSHLVENPIDRYAIRPDSPGFGPDPDGSTVIVISSERPAGVDQSRWLPAPDGPVRLGLRVYHPSASVIAGEWSPPAVRPLEASGEKAIDGR